MKKFISILFVFILFHVFTPQLVYAYEGIWFFNSDGQLTAFQDTKTRTKCFSILNNGNFLIKTGNYLYEIPPGKEFKILKTYFVSGDFNFVDKYSDDSHLVFEKQKLRLLDNKNRTVKIYDKKDKAIFKAFKFDENKILINQQRPNDLSMIDKQGNIIWEKPYGIRSFSLMDGDKILIVRPHGDSIHILDKNGNFLSEQKVPFQIRKVYKLGNKYLIFPANDKKKLFFTDTKFNIISVLDGLDSAEDFFMQLPNNGFAVVGHTDTINKMNFHTPENK